MKKIPARYTWLVMPAILALMMTFIISGISTLRAIGPAPDFLAKWLQAWGLSYVVAYPTMLVVMPLVRRLLTKIVEAPKG